MMFTRGFSSFIKVGPRKWRVLSPCVSWQQRSFVGRQQSFFNYRNGPLFVVVFLVTALRSELREVFKKDNPVLLLRMWRRLEVRFLKPFRYTITNSQRVRDFFNFLSVCCAYSLVGILFDAWLAWPEGKSFQESFVCFIQSVSKNLAAVCNFTACGLLSFCRIWGMKELSWRTQWWF